MKKCWKIKHTIGQINWLDISFLHILHETFCPPKFGDIQNQRDVNIEIQKWRENVFHVQTPYLHHDLKLLICACWALTQVLRVFIRSLKIFSRTISFDRILYLKGALILSNVFNALSNFVKGSFKFSIVVIKPF